jgi:SnoaL-like protein
MELLIKWHQAIQTRDVSILDEILSEEVVFYSPVVWSGQKGKALTKMYLTAALHVIGGNDFKYVNEIISNNQACLEFSTKIENTIINGVDLITTNDEGKIVEFKVMVRPLRGMMVLKEKMFELLEMMSDNKKKEQ